VTTAPEKLGVVAVGAKDAAAMFCVGERTWRRWNAAGLVPAPVKICGAVRWRVSELRAWGEAGCPSRARWEERRRR
jgi:predicted DNA-binding transcriptional regulator AlpA